MRQACLTFAPLLHSCQACLARNFRGNTSRANRVCRRLCLRLPCCPCLHIYVETTTRQHTRWLHAEAADPPRHQVWILGKRPLPRIAFTQPSINSFSNSNSPGCRRCRRHRCRLWGGSGTARWTCCLGGKRDSKGGGRGGGGGGRRMDRRPEQPTDMEVSRGFAGKIPLPCLFCFLFTF